MVDKKVPTFMEPTEREGGKKTGGILQTAVHTWEGALRIVKSEAGVSHIGGY